MPSTGSFLLNAPEFLTCREVSVTATTVGLIDRLAAELRSVYPGLNVLTNRDGLSIPREKANGFSIGLMLLENDAFYLNLGLAEFEVDELRMATDLLILGCSCDCRLRTTSLSGQVRDWHLDVRFDHQ